MFRRKKTPQAPPPLKELLEIYNYAADISLRSLSLEQSGRIQESLYQWRTLHNTLIDRLETLDKHITGVELTDEEANLLDEIRILQAQSDDHMIRIAMMHQPKQQPQKSPTKRPVALANNGSSSSLNVPTMRTANPQPMNTKKNAPRGLMKTLRGTAPTANVTSSGAKLAANLSWNDEPHRVWAPSTSLSQGKSYSSPEDAFRGFDSVADDELNQRRAESLEMLEQTGRTSRDARTVYPSEKSHRSEEDLADLQAAFSALSASKSAPSKKTQPVRKPQMSANAANALKKSAAVKPIARQTTRSPTPQTRAQPSRATPVNRTHAATSAKLVTKANARPPVAQATTQQPKRQPRAQPRVAAAPTSRSRTPAKEQPIDEGLSKDTETLETSDGNTSDDLDEDKLIASLRGVDPLAAKQILNEIIIQGDEVYWDDIAGLESAKNSLKETVVYPFLRPDLFSGLREPARGMLLFGPPGTGKTMLARAVATESKSTFFSISASSLTSKYLGESEKLVRALFQLAKKLAPSIIFVDEIDSLLSSRNNEGENESSRRIKNEFLVQWSDLTKAAAGRDQGEDAQRVLVLAATNLPWAIDEAARRRFVRRQYIPLPEYETRKAQLEKLLSFQNHTISEADFEKLIAMTDSFSGSDITALAKDAAMGPLRELGDKLLLTNKSDIRPVCLVDFVNSLQYIRPSVSKEGLLQFEDWAEKYGSSGV